MALLLHAVAVSTRLAIWGEDTDGVSPPVQDRVHPQAVESDVLQNLLSELGLGGDPIRFLPKNHLTLWLPTFQGAPLPSTTLSPVSSAGITIAPWVVPTMLLDGIRTFDLLNCCLQQGDQPKHIACAPDLTFWLPVASFACSLVYHQQFIPGMRLRDDAAYEACWEPYLSTEAQAAFATLAAGMPGATRAWGTDTHQSPAHDAVQVLYTILTTLVDTVVREIATPARRRQVNSHVWHGYPSATSSLPDRWKTALHPDENPIIPTTPTHARNLFDKVRQWHAQLQEQRPRRFHLCFRIYDVTDTPDQDEVVHWMLATSLQSRADPSLLVPLDAVWHEERLLMGDLKGVTHTDVLTALGSTLTLIPPLARSLASTQPGIVELTTREAYDFLTQTTLSLQQAGHLVQLPTWWQTDSHHRTPRLHAKIRSPIPSSGLLGMETLLDFAWELALGTDPITREELEELARCKEPLLRHRGQWITVNQDALAAALSRLRQRPSATIPVREALTLTLAPTANAEESVDPGDWLADFLSRLRTKASYGDIPAPRGLQIPLRPYQARAFAWLHFLTQFGFSACFADAMGLGKTLATLALIGKHWEERGAQPTLVVAPVSVIDHWRQEAARSFPDLPVVIYHGARRTETQDQFATAAIVLTSYGVIQRDETLRTVHWRAIIADEAQAIKNAGTRQARAIRHLTADYRIAITGTPVENSIEDLWSLFDFLNPGYLGSHAAFTRTYGIPITQHHDETATRTLRQLVGPFLLRRLKSDPDVAPDLPAKIEQTAHCLLTREQASLYTAAVTMLQRDLLVSTGMHRRGLILRSLTHLKQICNAPSLFLKDNSALSGRSGKLMRLEELLEEMLANGERGLIFTQFAEMGHQLQRYLSDRFGVAVFYLHGQTAKQERDRLIASFQQGDAPIFVLSLKAGGSGITLTAATLVIHYDRWWNPSVEDQASDRAHRIGQHRVVTVHRLVCQGTIEERIDELQTGKRTLADGIIIAGEDHLTELDTDTLLNLIRLQVEEVAL